MPSSQTGESPASVPGLTACSLCAGETLGSRDPAPGGQRGRLERLEAEGVARLTLSECLDECERGDVVVARPSAAGRAASGRPVWFERLAGDAPTAALRSWLASGGPGAAPVPKALTPLLINRGDTEPIRQGQTRRVGSVQKADDARTSEPEDDMDE